MAAAPDAVLVPPDETAVQALTLNKMIVGLGSGALVLAALLLLANVIGGYALLVAWPVVSVWVLWLGFRHPPPERLWRDGDYIHGLRRNPLARLRGKIRVRSRFPDYVERGKFEVEHSEAGLLRVYSDPLRARAFAEGLVRLGRYPMEWESDGSLERREPDEIDRPLVERLASGTLPLPPPGVPSGRFRYSSQGGCLRVHHGAWSTALEISRDGVSVKTPLFARMGSMPASAIESIYLEKSWPSLFLVGDRKFLRIVVAHRTDLDELRSILLWGLTGCTPPGWPGSL
jgi:hypothetical protein